MFIIKAFMYIGGLFDDLYHIIKTLTVVDYAMCVKFFGFYINIWGECEEWECLLKSPRFVECS
jgi:hypothetical protein